MIYRLDIRYPANRGGISNKFRLMITEDSGQTVETVATVNSVAKPTLPVLRAWLASKGFEAYGDMRQIGDYTIRSMVKKIS